jgi:hypothetical protein
MIQGSFALVHQACMYCTLIKLTGSSPLLTHSLSPRSPTTQQLTAQYTVLYSYTDELFQIFFIL